MKTFITNFYKEHPLKSILILGLIIRLVAVVFSQGYGFHDDHFLIIEESQSWVDGTDWGNWLPKGQLERFPDSTPVPEGHSLFYVGIHYLLFSGFELIGIHDPVTKMIFIRFLHALFSLLIISFSFKITKHYANEKLARQVGLLMALLWFMPFFSVRNLVEVVSIPFILWGLWLIIKDENDKNWKLLFLAGFLLGIAFSLRFQTLIISGGIGLVLLLQRRIKATILLVCGIIISITLVQGGIDLFIWGKPFSELKEYVIYNILHKEDYGTNNYYMYITLLPGMLLVPLGLFFFWGWFRTWKRYPLLFWPSFLFFAFHTYFPNKQERFIITIIPLFVIAGAIGWYQYMDQSKFWPRHQKLFKGLMVFFWVTNFLILPLISTTYSKRSRCESMVYLGKHTNAKSIILEDTNRDGTATLPGFYAGRWITMYRYARPTITDSTKYTWSKFNNRFTSEIQTPAFFKYNQVADPDYVLFLGEKRLDERISDFKKYYPEIQYETTIEPSYIDLLMKKLTPSNNNQFIYIYQIKH